jgi:hypothetical protein
LSDLLAALRYWVGWGIVVVFMANIVRRLNQVISDMMKTGKHVSNAAIALAPTAGGFAGPVLSAGAVVAGIIILLAVVFSFPVIVLATLTLADASFSFSSYITNSPLGVMGSVADSHPVIAQAFWYVNKAIPLELCVFAPVYYMGVSIFLIPSQFTVQIILRFLPI